MKTGRTVGQYMTRKLVTLRPDMGIHEGIRILLKHRLSGAPVVDDAGQLVGILSNKDCVRMAFGASYHQDWGGTVASAMSSPVETVRADADIVEVAELFLRGPYRRYPVLDGGRLVGQVSRYDILHALDDLWGSAGEG